jgi:hypothetical protein
MNIVNYFNPRHDGFEQAATHFHQLKGWQQILTVIASVVAGIITPFLLCSGSFAVFRWSVELCFKGDDKTVDLVDDVAQQVFQPHEITSHEESDGVAQGVFYSHESSSEEESDTASEDSEKLEELKRGLNDGSVDLSLSMLLEFENDPFNSIDDEEDVVIETLSSSSSSIECDDSVQLYRVKELISTFDPLWDHQRKEFNEIPFDLEEASALLNTHNKVFKYFLVDEKKNYGVLVKKDIDPGTQVYVRADLHGDLKSLLENLKELQREGLLDEHYRCRDNVQLVFLGDYMDRGKHGIEIVQILAALRLENLDQVHLIRGNHEDVMVNQMFGRLDDHLNAFLEDDEKSKILSTFYSTMLLTLYLGQNTGEKNEYIQFTHGLFEVRHDYAPVIDSTDSFALMPMPRALILSKRIGQIAFDSEVDYQAMINKEEDKSERRRLKQFHAAQRIYDLAKQDKKARGKGDIFTAFNWADVAQKTRLKSLETREWGLSPEDIKHCLRLSSAKHKVKMVFRGHQHSFAHHLDKKDRVLVSTLPVGMDSAGYMKNFDQLDRAYILDTAPKVKNWTKRAITRASGESESAVSDASGIREQLV